MTEKALSDNALSDNAYEKAYHLLWERYWRNVTDCFCNFMTVSITVKLFV